MKSLYAIYLVLILPGPIESAPPDVEPSITIVREDHPIRTDGARLPVVESHLAVDPKDATHLVAAAIVVRKSDLSVADCAVFVSFDGGTVWARHDFSFSECADPWVAIGEDGTVLITVLAGHQDAGPADLLVLRSEDGGRTWRGPLSLGSGHDHETMAVDRSSGPYRGSFYVASQAYAEEPGGKTRSVAFVVRSSDGGRTFHPPTRVLVSNLSLNTMNPVVLSDGTLLVPFEDYARSTDKGQLWLERERAARPTTTRTSFSTTRPIEASIGRNRSG